MKIAAVKVSALRNNAHFQFHTEFRELVTKENPQTLDVKTLFDAYLPLYEREDTALKKITKSALTQKIHDADKERDEVFVGFCALIRGHCRHFSPELRALAAPVQIVLDTYGHIASLPLNEQSSAIYNLVQELSLPKYQDARTNFGLTIWLNKLKTTNEAYEALVRERFNEDASKTDIVLREARNEIDKVYRSIIERINAIIIVNGPEKYENFVKTMNVIIAKYTSTSFHHHHDTAQTEKEEENGK
jgi:hypothetical protein